MEDTKSVRPSKKQRELLTFIEQFIVEHDYSPSYREIMAGCNYTSVATVSLHVNSLIKRGHLRKRDHSARSLEVVDTTDHLAAADEVVGNEEKWLTDKIEQLFQVVEQSDQSSEIAVRQLKTLVEALHLLGLDTMANRFTERLHPLAELVSSESQQA